jgi:hypothetical protein
MAAWADIDRGIAHTLATGKPCVTRRTLVLIKRHGMAPGTIQQGRHGILVPALAEWGGKNELSQTHSSILGILYHAKIRAALEPY